MLTFQITDLDGNVLGTVTEPLGGEVRISRNDSRTAKVSVSIYSEKSTYVRPLDRMLKVHYYDTLPFWGVILTPVWSDSAGQNSVEVNAHDQSIWWKKNYHRYGDRPVDFGYEMSGLGLRSLAESAIPLPNQIARGIPHPGILWGQDTSTRYHYLNPPSDGLTAGAGPRPTNIEAPAAGDGLYAMATRGQNVMETIQQVAEAVVGPDWELRPIDPNHPGSVAVYQPGFYAELNTYTEQGTDRSDSVIFHRGFGRNNLESMTWTPDGDQVINYAVEVWSGGETDRHDTVHRARIHSESSWQKYGIYEKWESSNSKDPQEVLVQKGQAWVDAYKEPPNFMTIVPRPAQDPDVLAGLVEAPPIYGIHYFIGDIIYVACKSGNMFIEGPAQVVAVTLSQDDKGIVRETIEVVPDLVTDSTAEDPGG